MNKGNVNIFLVGAGNHPVMLAGSLIAKAAFYEGYDTKNTSVIALGVIGGAVVSQVRLGNHIYSPLSQDGYGDYMVAFDRLEALRNCCQLKKNAIIILSDETVPPTSVTGLIESPVKDSVIEQRLIVSGRRIMDVPVQDCFAVGLDGQMALIGALSSKLEITISSWEKAMTDIFSQELLKTKRIGFEYGRRMYFS